MLIGKCSRQTGFTYMGVLMLMAIAGIGMAGVGLVWQQNAQRENEKELLFIGDAYRKAIASYYESSPGAKQFPLSLDDESEATVDLLAEGGYESVIVATGATPLKHGWSALHPQRWDGPALDGTGQSWVYSYGEVLGPALPLKEGAGRRAVLFDGIGARQGVVVAEYLARAGWAVEFVTQLGQAAPNLAASRDWGKNHGMLKRLGVRFTPDHEIASIGRHTVTLRDVFTATETQRRGVDALVLVNGARAEDGLYHELRRRLPQLEVHMIGDCVAPRRINDAIHEGELIARRI